MSDIFISYAREDREAARRLAEALEAQGWSVWWDTRLRAGEIWDQVIERELGAARCVVVLWSKISVHKHWVREEARKGLGRQILVPAFIEDVQPPLGFGLVQAGNLIGWNGDLAHPDFKQLVAKVADLVKEPPRAVHATDQEPIVSPTPPSTHPQGTERPETGPEPASPAETASDDGTPSRKPADFRKDAGSRGHSEPYLAAIKRYVATIAHWRPSKRHLAMAGGGTALLLIVGGIGYSLYEPPPKPNGGEVTCHDQEAANSLFTSLQKTGEAYQKDRITIVDRDNVQKRLLDALTRQVEDSSTVGCISQVLKRMEALYRQDAFNIAQWTDSRGRLWKALHNLLLARSKTDEEIEQALIVINQLYDQDAIGIVELNATRKALNEKFLQNLEPETDND